MLPNAYDTMRFLRAGIGSGVVGTDLTLVDILAGANGVSLVYKDADGRRHTERLNRTEETGQ